ncbi:hypothetical protein WJX79_002984 [Trebouxia sp. C0005]
MADYRYNPAFAAVTRHRQDPADWPGAVMARRRVQYGVVDASDAEVGAGAPGFRTMWHSKEDLREQLMEIDDVPKAGRLYFWDGELWLRWEALDDLPGPEQDPLRIKVVRPQNAGQAARPDKPASSFAEFLQSQAGKQQMAAGAGSVISLPLCVRLMGLSRWRYCLHCGWSLVVRQLETAVNMLPSGALQDTVQQILTTGWSFKIWLESLLPTPWMSMPSQNTTTSQHSIRSIAVVYGFR